MIALLLRRAFSSTTTTTTTSNNNNNIMNSNNNDHSNNNNNNIIEYSTEITELMIDEIKEQLIDKTTVVTTNKYELQRHGTDESYHTPALPSLVIYPTNINDIRNIVKYCYKYRIPLVPYGAGTSVEGHVQCLYPGSISLDMSLLQNITLPNNDTTDNSNEYTSVTDPIAIVGAGVTRKQFNEYAKNTGYYFTVDPGADATLGGMVSTGASGTTAMHYGTMRNNILKLQCILPNENATIVNVGTNAIKNSAGYDLLSLLTGSEGTLGIITEITIKLHPIQDYKATAVAVFDSILNAANVASILKNIYEVPVLRCELLDSTSVAAFNKYSNKNLQIKPTLFIELQSFSNICLNEQLKLVQEVCVEQLNAISFESSTDTERSIELWEARHKLYYAAIAARKGAEGAIVTDICVPLSKFATVLQETIIDVDNSNVIGPCFGHAGDGNLHCILPVCNTDIDTGYINTLYNIQERLMERTINVGGTVTGEHGVGCGKIKYLHRQYGTGAPYMMKLIKNAIDPRGILNPGKVIV